MKKLNDFEWRVQVHGIGMAGYQGRVSWTAKCDISTNQTFKSQLAALRHFKKFAKKYGIKNTKEEGAFTLVQFVEKP